MNKVGEVKAIAERLCVPKMKVGIVQIGPRNMVDMVNHYYRNPRTTNNLILYCNLNVYEVVFLHVSYALKELQP